MIVSVEAFEINSHRGDLESCGDLSWEDLSDKPEDLSDRESEARGFCAGCASCVSPSSVVTEFCDGFSCCSDWEFVEPQSFPFFRKACSPHSCAGRGGV